MPRVWGEPLKYWCVRCGNLAVSWELPFPGCVAKQCKGLESDWSPQPPSRIYRIAPESEDWVFLKVNRIKA
jgi:hypothetical protein